MATVTSYTKAEIDTLFGAISPGTDWVVVDPTADSSGVSDYTNIQGALNSSPEGSVVYLKSQDYFIDAQLSIPANKLLLGALSLDVPYAGNYGTVIKVTSGFTDDSAIKISNGTAGSTFAPAGSISNITIDGSACTAATVDGIQGFGNCIRAIVSNMVIGGMSGVPYRSVKDTAASAGNQLPMFWDFKDVLMQACAGGGPYLETQNDTYYQNVYVLGCGGTTNPGWKILNGAANCRFDNCRAEWSGAEGLVITGTDWNGAGSGGSIWNNFSTDRNGKDGVKIDATGSSAPIVFNNLMLRRDGRNGGTGGGGYSGFNANATTLPITVGSISCYPGVDDDGSGTSSPQYGVSVSGSSAVSLGNGYVQAATSALNIGSGNIHFYVSAGLVTATGPTTAPANVNGNAEQGNGVALTGMPAAALTGVTTLQSIMTGLKVPANGAFAGQTYNFDIWGLITTTLAAQTADFSVYLGGTGGTSIGDTGAQQPNTGGAVTNVPFRFKGKIQFQSGTAVTVTTELSMNYFLKTMSVAQTTVVTTSAKDLAIGYTPSATAVSLTVQGGTFRRSLD